ncbi:MAG: hypothetical protein KDB50_09490 [Mycobacterium sp.]|nr:hypothetical protein [Mycobacterium sp.]
MTTVVTFNPKNAQFADGSVDTVAAEAASGPDFTVGVRARVMLAFAGLLLPAAAALYVYGQISPGV